MFLRRFLTLAVGAVSASVVMVSVAQAAEPVPDRGRFTIDPLTGGPFVGTVNAVQVTGDATVVYLSVGFAAGPEGSSMGSSGFLGFGQASSDDIAAPADSSLRLLRVIDAAGGKVYRPLQTASSAVCVCTPMDTAPEFDPATQLMTFAVVLPKLPDTVDRVDVDVTGKGLIVPDVEVSRGEALTPVKGDGQGVVMGQGWPQVDLAEAKTVTDVSPFVTDLIASTEDLDRTQRVVKTPRTTEVSVAADVLFAFDKATLSSKAQTQLARVAQQLKSAEGTVTVTGYTDSDGSDSSNLDLSKRRAEAVVAALTTLSPGTSFTAAGKGSADPVAPNTNVEGKQLNRRVTISFASKDAK